MHAGCAGYLRRQANTVSIGQANRQTTRKAQRHVGRNESADLECWLQVQLVDVVVGNGHVVWPVNQTKLATDRKVGRRSAVQMPEESWIPLSSRRRSAPANQRGN